MNKYNNTDNNIKLIEHINNDTIVQRKENGNNVERTVWEETVLLNDSVTKIVTHSGLGVRHVQTVLLFFAMFIAYSMRVNMSMAIVDMTNKDNNNVHFDWSLSVQSIILSSFFWGYVILQVPAGELARRFGGKSLLSITITVNSLLLLLLPVAATYGGWKLVCVCRILQGFTQAFLYPVGHHLISQWVPLEDKGLHTAIIYGGCHLGVAFQLVISGFLATSWGWQAIFYTNGVIGLIWMVIYGIFGADSPETSKFIGDSELKHIQQSLGRNGEEKRYRTPWVKIMTSVKFWAVIVAHCGQNWGYFTLMTEMPTYMAKVLGATFKNNGILSSLPFLAMYLCSFVMGGMTDLIVRRKWLNITNTRKLFNTIGCWIPAAVLIGLSYAAGDNILIAVILLTITQGINSGIVAGYMLVHIDIAPNFSGCLMGITNFLANIVSIIAPLVCGILVNDETDPYEWRKVFFVAAGVYFFTNLFFIIFSSSERQPWNEPNYDDVETKSRENSTAEMKS